MNNPNHGETGEAANASRRAVRAWMMYDWANSAFATVIMAAVFPIFYRSLAREAGLDNEDATAAWSYTNSAAMLLVALAGPVLGALADITGRKKTLLGLFAGLGILGSASLVLLRDGDYLLGSLLFVMGLAGFAGGNVFYESLLPHLVGKGELDRISARAYALGYLGGGLLLLLNLAWLSFPGWFLMPGPEFALRACFVSVAVWWLVFSLPLFRHVPEPGGRGRAPLSVRVVGESFRRFGRTFREVRRHRQLALFLLAFWIYNDGIGTIIKIAAAYGDEIGLGQRHLLQALLLTQLVGVPCALVFGWLGPRMGTKRAILMGLAAYTVICLLGFFVTTPAHFYGLALAVGLVQGGTQALSRSLFSTMVPKNESAKFFGLFSTGQRLAGILGPFLFGLIGQLAGSSRWGILSIALFFVVGAVLLSRVNEAEGQRVAAEADAESAPPEKPGAVES